jgi:hypothetical protein
MPVPGSVIDVLLLPGDRELGPGDWEWPDQVRPLLSMLRSHDIDVRERMATPDAGQKGAAAEIIIALGSSGAIGAALAVLQSWLNQRSTRTVSLTFDRDGHTRTIELQATGLSEDGARAALVAAVEARTETESTAES